MVNRTVIVMILLFSSHSFGYSFGELATKIKNHPKIESFQSKAAAVEEEGDIYSSWGDPTLRLEAMNYPINSFRNDTTPMTGLALGAAQNFPITKKNSYIEKSYNLKSKSLQLETVHQFRSLLHLLWNLSIEKKKLKEDENILKENLVWVNNMIKVSKKLYATGKQSQQAVLELQVRKSQISAEISNKKHELQQIEARLSYLYGEGDKTLSLETVPWKLLEITDTSVQTSNYKEKGLALTLEANEALLKAEKLSIIPDITLSAAYIRRPFFDEMDDFVTIGISMPIPLSSREYSEVRKVVHDTTQAAKKLKNYSWYIKTELSALLHQIQKINDELRILTKETIIYSRSSRDSTSKAYGVGTISYIELTQAELNLQNLLLRKNLLESQLLSTKIQFKFLRGDELYVE